MCVVRLCVVYAHVYKCMGVYMYESVRVCARACSVYYDVYTHTYTHTYIHTHIHTCVRVYMFGVYEFMCVGVTFYKGILRDGAGQYS